MKKLCCFLLCLLLPLTALAAPMRDMRTSVLSASELSTMRAWLDTAVRQALPLEYDDNTYVGAYVYACVEDGGCYVLECDVYLEEGGDSLPLYAADDALTWLCDATVCIQRQGAGYALISCDVGDYYMAQAYRSVTNDEYAVNLPEVYEVNLNDAYDYSCYADGQLVSGIRYRKEACGGQDLRAYAQSLSGEGNLLLSLNEDIALLTAQDSGLYMIVYWSEGYFYSLTLTYPEDREAEFTLYAEFIRNSFVVYGQANG